MNKWNALLNHTGRYRKYLTGSNLIILGILLFAALLRLNGLNWDSGFGFHPDERSLYLRADCMYRILAEALGYKTCVSDYPNVRTGMPGISTFLNPDTSPLNPRWFPLGSVLIYLLVAIRFFLEIFVDLQALDMRYAGRILSALADIASVGMIYIIGRRLFSTRIGLLAAFFMASSAINVQSSHFYRPETFSALFCLFVFWALIRLYDEQRLRDVLIVGALLGLALSPKINVVFLVLPLFVTCFLISQANSKERGYIYLVSRLTIYLGISLLSAMCVYVLLNPYAVLDIGTYYSDVKSQSLMAKNAGMWPFTTQYVGTMPLLYQLKQSVVWGLGIPIGVISWSGVIFSIVLLCRRKASRFADSIILIWLVPQLIFLESFEVHFTRYLFCLIPFMVLLGARLLISIVDSARHIVVSGNCEKYLKGVLHWMPLHRFPNAYASNVITISFCAFVTLAILPGLAFSSVYLEPHTAVQGSEWLHLNVPSGTKILSDNHWDEFIPGMERYDVWQFPLYESDSREKISELARNLSESDYLVFYSYRPFVSALRAEDKYPLSAQYYRFLFEGKLGYELVERFHSYPSLWRVSLKDDPYSYVGLPEPLDSLQSSDSHLHINLGYADDNVVGYDHPQVLIFQNTAKLPFAMIDTMLSRVSSSLTDNSNASLLMQEETFQTQVSGGTWSERFSNSYFVNKYAAVIWLISVELIYVITLPIAIILFRFLPDRGIIFARTLGLLLISYLSWMLVNLNLMSFGREVIVISIAVTALVSGLIFWRYKEQILSVISDQWRLITLSEILFISLFIGFLMIRMFNPDLWHPFRGGEKPMDMAYLQAVARTSLFPPYDPWFSGGIMNYYYWGYLIVSVPLLITTIPPHTAFNLAVPLLFALAATGAFSIVFNLATKTCGPVNRVENNRKAFIKYLERPVMAGIIGVCFVALIGNLDGMLQIITAGLKVFYDPTYLYSGFDFWKSSRVIPPGLAVIPFGSAFWMASGYSGPSDISYHITEFPFFSFLFADLHAHMMVIPFGLLSLGLLLNLFLCIGRGSKRYVTAITLVLGVSIGSLWAINSWDYPSYLLVAIATVAVAIYYRNGSVWYKCLYFLLITSCIIASSVVAFWPFWNSYETFGAGISLSLWITPLSSYLVIHGLFLAVITWFMCDRAFTCGKCIKAHISLEYLTFIQNRWIKYFVLSVLIGFPAYLIFIGYYTACLNLVILEWAILNILNKREQIYENRSVVFSVILLGIGCAIALGVEFLKFNNDIGRMNTLFKFYLHVWVFYSLSASFMLWYLLQRHYSRPSAIWLYRCASFVVIVLILGCINYPIFGTLARIQDRFDTEYIGLDGSAYMITADHVEQDNPIDLNSDRGAIRWLQSNVQGTPIILEAHDEQYHWSSRISSNTGLPTILGWPWHQMQQRNNAISEINRRKIVISDIYNTTMVYKALKLLEDYHVTYIVVGQLERIHYSPDGLQKFNNMDSDGLLETVFNNQGTTVYRILP